MLCEVRYGERKQAIAHYGEGDDKRTKKLLDLTTAEHQENLRRIVTSTRINRDQLQATSAEKEDISESDDSNGRCVRLEILCPLEFLKNITLIDSPGTTEDDSENSDAREMTEKAQRDVACGSIFVLDGSRSAQEAAQVRLT
ncbi:uncharacterized protein LOC134196246 [Corticium candelabrum]|uniref:uncharacterized protein LOC134196246 n=1 Tax=Corticium candelabrum TaxID=121492 RepID=UPI002E274FA9|nr:uncharacterized protein LOC134196246 [Corticium candelabrum]